VTLAYAGLTAHATGTGEMSLAEVRAHVNLGETIGVGAGISFDVEVQPMEVATDAWNLPRSGRGAGRQLTMTMTTTATIVRDIAGVELPREVRLPPSRKEIELPDAVLGVSGPLEEDDQTLVPAVQVRVTRAEGGKQAAAAVTALADLSGRPALTRTARLVAGGDSIASVAFLIHDLGRPERYLHMLRVSKPTSPLSVG
jgi:hypothetical protein